MADRELIAATLAAGLLEPIPLPQDPAEFDEWIARADGVDRRIDQAIALYRLVFQKLGGAPGTRER